MWSSFELRGAMSIECLREDGIDSVPKIKISGRFDFSTHRRFREVWTEAGEGEACIIDMEYTTYIDSSALGMLLLLREAYTTVRIQKCPDHVMRVFSIAHFNQMFQFE